MATLSRRAATEFLGSFLLIMAVVGSGIMAERLAAGNTALALLANSLATGAALVAILLAFGPISGAHLNPVVTLMDAWQKGISWSDARAYVAAQFAGTVSGVVATHLMFSLPAVSLSRHARSSAGLWLGEFLAAFGLLSVIWACARHRPSNAAYAVGAYITGAYWFTSSTSFANPAVTVARCLTDTFSGIRPQDAPMFLCAQCAGAVAATVLFQWLLPVSEKIAQDVAASSDPVR